MTFLQNFLPYGTADGMEEGTGQIDTANISKLKYFFKDRGIQVSFVIEKKD